MYHTHSNTGSKEWADKAKIYYITKTNVIFFINRGTRDFGVRMITCKSDVRRGGGKRGRTSKPSHTHWITLKKESWHHERGYLNSRLYTYCTIFTSSSTYTRVWLAISWRIYLFFWRLLPLLRWWNPMDTLRTHLPGGQCGR